MAIRFHLDEHVSPVVAESLRRRGVDVSTSQEARLLGETDFDQLSFATEQGRALVTCDHGFLTRHVVQSAEFGICFCEIDKYSTHQLSEALLIVAECMHEDEMRFHVQYL
jgi:predicted nuclease of predicted toxin-antitoxin system